MKTYLLTVASTVAAITFAGSAFASTVPVTICEGGGPGIGIPAGDCDTILGDFNTNVSDPTLTIGGDTAIYGGVTHQGGSGTNYVDAWTIDFGTSQYEAVFNWDNASGTRPFDGELVVGGVVYQLDEGGTIDLGTLTGVVTFVVDPIAGQYTTREDAFWNLQLAAVPVPAAGLLLLTAIGGLGFARRRKANAA